MSAESSPSSEDFYVFSTTATEDPSNLELYVEDKLITIVIDSGASCNLMSEEMFKYVTEGKVNLSKCDKRVYAYASKKPLHLKGKCTL